MNYIAGWGQIVWTHRRHKWSGCMGLRRQLDISIMISGMQLMSTMVPLFSTVLRVDMEWTSPLTAAWPCQRTSVPSVSPRSTSYVTVCGPYLSLFVWAANLTTATVFCMPSPTASFGAFRCYRTCGLHWLTVHPRVVLQDRYRVTTTYLADDSSTLLRGRGLRSSVNSQH